jgi:hypothetical protein
MPPRPAGTEVRDHVDVSQVEAVEVIDIYSAQAENNPDNLLPVESV